MTGSEIPYFIASRMVDAASSPFWCQLALCRHWLGLHYSHRSFPLSAATTLNSSPPLSLLRRGNFPSGSYTMGMTPCPFACRLDKNGRADFDWLGDFALCPLWSAEVAIADSGRARPYGPLAPTKPSLPGPNPSVVTSHTFMHSSRPPNDRDGEWRWVARRAKRGGFLSVRFRQESGES